MKQNIFLVNTKPLPISEKGHLGHFPPHLISGPSLIPTRIAPAIKSLHKLGKGTFFSFYFLYCLSPCNCFEITHLGNNFGCFTAVCHKSSRITFKYLFSPLIYFVPAFYWSVFFPLTSFFQSFIKLWGCIFKKKIKILPLDLLLVKSMRLYCSPRC